MNSRPEGIPSHVLPEFTLKMEEFDSGREIRNLVVLLSVWIQAKGFQTKDCARLLPPFTCRLPLGNNQGERVSSRYRPSVGGYGSSDSVYLEAKCNLCWRALDENKREE